MGDYAVCVTALTRCCGGTFPEQKGELLHGERRPRRARRRDARRLRRRHSPSALLGVGVLHGVWIGAVGSCIAFLLLQELSPTGLRVDDLATVVFGLVLLFLAALIGAVLGAASAACAASFALVGTLLARRIGRSSVAVGVGAALGGGGSTAVLILMTMLLPGLPIVLVVGLACAVALLDAVGFSRLWRFGSVFSSVRDRAAESRGSAAI